MRYREAVRAGNLPSGGERFLSYVEPSENEAEAFDAWFYSAKAKAASARHVHGFILRRRHGLYRAA